MKNFFLYLLIVLSSGNTYSASNLHFEQEQIQKNDTNPTVHNAISGTMQTQASLDSIALEKAFELLKTNPTFLKELGLENEKGFWWNDDFRNIIIGDLNGDGVADALFLIMIEDIGIKGNWNMHYAVFLNENNKWEYKSQLDAGGKRIAHILSITQIENEKIIGIWLAEDESVEGVPASFIFKNGSVIIDKTVLQIEKSTGKQN